MAAIAEPTTTTTRTSRPRYVAPVLPHCAAVYTRVSTRRQGEEDKTSLATQEEGCRKLAKADGVPVSTELVILDKHTGEELHERPGLTRLREAAKRHEFSHLYIHSTDRLSRDPIHLGIVLEEMERAGVTVTFVTEPLDDSEEGQLIRYVHGYGNKMENAKRRERQMRAVRARAERGKLIPGARALYGYAFGPERDKDGKLTKVRLVPDPVKAPIVVRIHRDAARGIPIRRIAAMLTAEGIPTPTGKQARWDPATVLHILKHPTYRGQAAALRHKKIPVEKRVRSLYATKSRTIHRPENERIALPESTAPALVSPDLAAQVDARLKLNKQQASRNNPYPEETLVRGGIGRCGECGCALNVWRHIQRATSRKPEPERVPMYRCTKATGGGDCHVGTGGIVAKRLDDAVWAKVSEYLRDPRLIRQEVAGMRETEDPGADVLATIDRQLAEVARRIKNKREYAELVDDERERAEVAGEVKLLWEQHRALEAERQAAQVHYAQWKQDQEGLERLLDVCQRWGENLDSLNQIERREFLLTLKAEVKLYRVDHTPRAELIIHLPLSGAKSLELNGLANSYCGENLVSFSSQSLPLRLPLAV